MSISKGYTRPEHWPPVSSILQTTENSPYFEKGLWVVVHLTNGYLRDDQNNRWPIKLSLLFDGRHGEKRPLFKVFRSGRHDYSEAWHQTLPWMENTR